MSVHGFLLTILNLPVHVNLALINHNYHDKLILIQKALSMQKPYKGK